MATLESIFSSEAAENPAMAAPYRPPAQTNQKASQRPQDSFYLFEMFVGGAGVNEDDKQRWTLIGEYRAPYVANSIVIAIMTNKSGDRFLAPLTSGEAANAFNEVIGEDMSSLMIAPSLDLLVEWGLGDRIEDKYVETRYVLYREKIDVFYDNNWDEKEGLIYKLRAGEPYFLQEALMRTEDAAVVAFERGERAGNLVERSEKETELQKQVPLRNEKAVTKLGPENDGEEPLEGHAIVQALFDLNNAASIATIVAIPLAILLWWFS